MRKKLAIVTGPGDFRYCFLKDIVNRGYKKAAFTIKLFDYKGYGHELAGYGELKNVMEYFEK